MVKNSKVRKVNVSVKFNIAEVNKLIGSYVNTTADNPWLTI
jgi:hypothetical protein